MPAGHMKTMKIFQQRKFRVRGYAYIHRTVGGSIDNIYK